LKSYPRAYLVPPPGVRFYTSLGNFHSIQLFVKTTLLLGLKFEEIEANSLTFFIAGYDTTANTLSFACFCLATNPEIQDKVFEEIDTVLTEVSA
jgi:hypothetical protein